MTAVRRFAPTRWLILFLSGLIVWAAYFLGAYAFVALACARGFATAKLAGGLVLTIVPLALAVSAIVIVAVAWSRMKTPAHGQEDGGRPFLMRAGRLIAMLAVIAILLSTLPPLLVGC